MDTKSWYLPKRNDNLFWCIYIALYGYNKYEQISHHYGNTEIQEKQNMMELMRKTPTTVKYGGKKITKVLFQEIMSDFMTNKRITNDMLLMFAIYLNKCFLIVNVDNKHSIDKMYIELGDISNETFIFYKHGKYDFSIELSNGDEFEQKIEKIRSTLFRFDHYDLPLKAISNYKTDELMSMSGPLHILWDSAKKYKKSEIYSKIYESTATS